MPSSRRDEDEDDLDFDDDESSEELESQVQKAQAELGELKRRAEQIEKDKARLEEMGRRQDELEAGRAEMVDKLTRSLVIVQRESEESQKRLEQLHSIHGSFLTHLRTLEDINPRMWTGPELPKELSKSLSAVDDARAEHLKLNAKVAPDIGDDGHSAGGSDYYDDYAGVEKGFSYWLTAGFAFTLPVMVLIILIVLVVWMTVSGGAS
ncbi:MAG: hypothetical protein WA771_06875 [Chthoniobacterales bacterium]